MQDKPYCAPKRRAKISSAKRLRAFARDGFRCLCCGAGEDLSVDHIHPLALGGSSRSRNLQTLCRPCNRRKGATVFNYRKAAAVVGRQAVTIGEES
jgi:5-methylcytosine-specific restriction endonuclease McrA